MAKVSVKQLGKLNKNGATMEDVSLSQYCTYKCGGKCSVFMEINTLENFLAVMNYLE